MRMFSLIMAVAMLVLVFTIAGVFTFTPYMESEMQGAKRISFVVLLWLYGAYRTYRLYVLQKQNKNNGD